MTLKIDGNTSRLEISYQFISRLKQDPVPFIHAEFLPSNILEWHYVLIGPSDSPFRGGYYHGSLIFTKDFPFKPPSIYMYTPNGRFKPGKLHHRAVGCTKTDNGFKLILGKRLCLSISDFHPDTWNPAWSASTILTGLLSIMLENTPLLGSCESTNYEKRKLAMNSMEFNLKNEIFR